MRLTKARHCLPRHLAVLGHLGAVSGAASPPPGVRAHHAGVKPVVGEDLHLHETTVLTTLHLGRISQVDNVMTHGMF